MKKQLLDLTIDEFTSVLLRFEPQSTLELSLFDEDGNCINDRFKKDSEKKVQITDTRSNIYDEYIKNINSKKNQIKDSIKQFLEESFDYNISINNLDIYNYLEHITCQFQEERVRIVLSEMDLFYQMTYLETINQDAQEQYITNGWDFPTREFLLKNKEGVITERDTVYDFVAMRERIYPCRDFMYFSATSLLKRKIPSQQIKENNQFKSDIYLSEKKGYRVNFIRIINCLSILGFFKDGNGGDIAKQKVMEAFGALLNKDFSTFSNDLSSTKSASNKDGNSLTKIFDEMLNKQKEINGIDQ